MFILVVYAAMLALVGFGVFIHEWEGVAFGGAVAIYLLPTMRSELGSLLEHTRFEGMMPSGKPSLSRAQQMAVLGLLLPVVIVWRFIDRGWVAGAILLLGLAGLLVWLAFVVRSEGWSGEKADEKEPVDSLR